LRRGWQRAVGYQVRFEEKSGPRTRLRFMTEGILTRRLLRDPMLRGVDAVVLDEFHERHMESDLALALLLRLRTLRPDLKLIVMSATLDAAPIASHLGECPVLRSEGRMYPLTVRYQPYSPEPLEVLVKTALQTLITEGHAENVLVFLPGMTEIRRSQRSCDAVARAAGIMILPLHGELTPAEQDLAVMPSVERKLILATNVAESSVTVEGVTAVIDSGLVRTSVFSPWTGLPTLRVGRISRASAKQRAGRAGRTGPGQVIRLYAEEDFRLRPEHDTPEIARSDLSQLLLGLRAMDVHNAKDLAWLTPPPEEAIEAAGELLDRLGAVGSMAKRLATLPLPPRLARLVVEAVDRGAGEDGCRAAAMLALGERTVRTDLLEAIELPMSARRRQHTEQLLRVLKPKRQTGHHDEALLMAVLTGFPDRVARRRAGGQVLLSSGGSAEITGDVPQYEFLLAIDAEDRQEQALPLIRMTARIEPEWLLDMFADRIEERTETVWNRSGERVERVSALLYDKLVLQESRAAARDEAAAALLAEKAIEAGISTFVDHEALESWQARLSFAGVVTMDIADALRELCAGLQSFAELRVAGDRLLPMLEARAGSKRLHELAPLSLRLGNGRQTKVHYEHGKPPWIASRVQDFFGMRETPRIGPERTPVVIQLLAPNQRAVQTTTDLAGFWERLYPQVRRELMRRYPRHAWPENPLAVAAPAHR
jgi:ATP-dependent helicase HrpB